MLSRLVSSVAVAIVLAGCAHEHSDRFTLFDDAGPPAEEQVPAAASVPVVPATAGWGDATVVPAGVVGPHAVADEDGPYLLDSGDKLRIFVYGQPNLSRGYTVDHAGMISVPLIGAVKARGITTYDLEGAIRAALGRQFVRDPQVTVDVSQARPFFILGEVKSAGQYPYVSGMTIETAVAIAGGYGERASERRARLSRRINGIVEVLEVPPHYVVKPGDTIYIFERYF